MWSWFNSTLHSEVPEVFIIRDDVGQWEVTEDYAYTGESEGWLIHEWTRYDYVGRLTYIYRLV